MPITPIANNMNIIAALPDEPNVDGGLTPAQLKAEFDKAGNILKTYINGTMIPDIDNSIALGGITVGGEYAPEVTYQPRTLVTYLGDVFITLQVVTGVTPTDDNVNYSLLIASPEMDLGNNANQAFFGDLGKIAYDHSQIVTGNPHGTTVADLGAVPNSRTINGFPLSANVTLGFSDVGASPTAHPHGAINNAGYVGNGSSGNYLTLLASNTTGQLQAWGLSELRSLQGLGFTFGALPIANGGTNATTAAAALTNLGVTFGTSDLVANSSALTSGSFYFVYV